MDTRAVSVVVTVLNEADTIHWLFNSLTAQTYPFFELVIVDGGSTDGTVEKLRQLSSKCPFDVIIIESPNCNISKGRNIGIEAATNDIIAVTDGGCILDKSWLETITSPVRRRAAKVAGGVYQRRDPNNLWEKVVYEAFNIPLQNFISCPILPSSRSICFTRDAWRIAGGYPEHVSKAGEDTLFNSLLIAKGFHIEIVPTAVVKWENERTLGELIRKSVAYGRGDGETRAVDNLYRKMLLRFVLGATLLIWSFAAKSVVPVFALFAFNVFVVFRRVRGKGRTGSKVALFPLIVFAHDIAEVAKLFGYWDGRLRRIFH